jgi:hypothetical protein
VKGADIPVAARGAPARYLIAVARMARFGVRSGSVAFARWDDHGVNTRFERTGANGRERRSHLPCRRSWVRVPSSALKSLQIAGVPSSTWQTMAAAWLHSCSGRAGFVPVTST